MKRDPSPGDAATRSGCEGPRSGSGRRGGKFRAEIAGALPFVIYIYTALTVAMFALSLRYHFLDFIFVGALSGYQGWDYFQIPQAFDCLSKGINVLHSAGSACEYGPWTTTFYLHPMVAILPGAGLHALRPWTSYTLFVTLSLFSLVVMAIPFARLTEDRLARSLVFLFLLGNWPLYLLLWMGQAHIFPVLAFGLVALAVLRLEAGRGEHAAGLIVFGLLLGLLSKPIVALVLPGLLAVGSTRRPALLALGLYILVSLLWLAVPWLNPGQTPLSALLDGAVSWRHFLGSGNGFHWTHTLLERATSIPINNRESYSLASILHVVLPARAVLDLLRLVTVLLTAHQLWLLISARTESVRLRLLAVYCGLACLSFFLVDTLVYEYYYPAVAVVPAVSLALLQKSEDRRLRLWLGLGAISYLPYLLPSIFPLIVPNPTRDVYWDFSHETLAQMTAYRAFRALPVVFLILFGLLAARRLRQLAHGHSNRRTCG